MNIDSSDGQRPPDGESERLHREPAPNYAPAAEAGHFVKERGGHAVRRALVDGHRLPIDFTSAEAERWWRELARGALDLGAEGIKADDGEGYYFPDDVRFADGRSGAELAGVRRSLLGLDAARAGRVHPAAAACCSGAPAGRAGSDWACSGVATRPSDFWSLRVLVAATLTAAASGFSNWSHDVGGYLGERLVARCPKELLLRWLQFGCFTPLLQSHGRFPQEAWTYDEQTLELYREYLLLHERLVPYVRAAAATAARCGLPITRPLLSGGSSRPPRLGAPRSYAYGPALWVAPVLEAGAARAPRGAAARRLDRLLDAGARPWRPRADGLCAAREDPGVGALGLDPGHPPRRARRRGPWRPPRGRAPARGHPVGRAASWARAGVRLADGTRIRWRRGEWSVDREREITFAER